MAFSDEDMQRVKRCNGLDNDIYRLVIRCEAAEKALRIYEDANGCSCDYICGHPAGWKNPAIEAWRKSKGE